MSLNLTITICLYFEMYSYWLSSVTYLVGGSVNYTLCIRLFTLSTCKLIYFKFQKYQIL